jgi:hypothetical protein
VIPVVTTHWDNFGFTSVTGPTRVVRQYRGTNSAAYRLVGPTLSDASNTFTIAIPDSIAGATAARVKFSRQGDSASNNRFWQGDAIVCFNSLAWRIYGQSTTCRRLLAGAPAEDRSIGPIDNSDPQGLILQVPVSSLQASNTLRIQLPANMYIGDILIEVEFPAGYAGPYTPPTPWFGQLSGPVFHPAAVVQVGPTARLTSLGSATLWRREGMELAMKTAGGVVVPGSTMLSVDGEVDSTVGLQTFGRTFGIVLVQLLVDRQIVQTWTFPSPGVPYFYISSEIDTGKLAAGVHEISIVAYDTAGLVSVPQYDFPNSMSLRNKSLQEYHEELKEH